MCSLAISLYLGFLQLLWRWFQILGCRYNSLCSSMNLCEAIIMLNFMIELDVNRLKVTEPDVYSFIWNWHHQKGGTRDLNRWPFVSQPLNHLYHTTPVTLPNQLFLTHIGLRFTTYSVLEQFSSYYTRSYSIVSLNLVMVNCQIINRIMMMKVHWDFYNLSKYQINHWPDEICLQFPEEEKSRWGAPKETHIKSIFRISRKGEEDRLAACNLDNHMLLWHGTSPTNLISILKRGLLVTPPEAPITGFRFGRGIYTADSFAKSIDYCDSFHNLQSDVKYMLLCEVSMTRSLMLYSFQRIKGQFTNSTRYRIYVLRNL